MSRKAQPLHRTLAAWASIVAVVVLGALPMLAAGAATARAAPMAASAMGRMDGMERSKPCRSPLCALVCALSACNVQERAEPLSERPIASSTPVVYSILQTYADGVPSELATPPPR